MQKQESAEDKGKSHDAIPRILLGAFSWLRRGNEGFFSNSTVKEHLQITLSDCLDSKSK